MKAVGLGSLDNAVVKANNNSQVLRLKVKIGTTAYTKSFGTLTLGQWAHFAYTYDGTQLKVYFNGVLNNTTTDSGGIQFGGNEAKIGMSDPSYLTNEWPGAVDEVRIYSRALSATDVSALFNYTPVLTYDANGNITRKGCSTFKWNTENQLESVTPWSSLCSSDSLTFIMYDSDGNRVLKTQNGTTTHYGSRSYEKNVDSGAVAVHYWLGGELVAAHDGSSLRFIHTDLLGSPFGATDSSKALVGQHAYLPFGYVRSVTGATGTSRDFTGQYRDVGTLHFYNARYYDSDVGRFMSPDSIIPDPLDAGSFNRYVYVRNNPLKYTDPSGHACFATSGTALWQPSAGCSGGELQAAMTIAQEQWMIYSDPDYMIGNNILKVTVQTNAELGPFLVVNYAPDSEIPESWKPSNQGNTVAGVLIWDVGIGVNGNGRAAGGGNELPDESLLGMTKPTREHEIQHVRQDAQCGCDLSIEFHTNSSGYESDATRAQQNALPGGTPTLLSQIADSSIARQWTFYSPAPAYTSYEYGGYSGMISSIYFTGEDPLR